MIIITIILVMQIIMRMTIKLTALMIIQKQQHYRQYRPTKQTPLFRNKNPKTMLTLPCKKLTLSCKKVNTKAPIRHFLQYQARTEPLF